MSPLMITEAPVSEAPRAIARPAGGGSDARTTTAERRRYVRRAAVVEAAWLASLR
jgi:hypothetical protein